MSDKFNEALATGRAFINRDPLDVLKELRAAVGWSGGQFVIGLGKDHESYLFKRLTECIAFNDGGDTQMETTMRKAAP